MAKLPKIPRNAARYKHLAVRAAANLRRGLEPLHRQEVGVVTSVQQRDEAGRPVQVAVQVNGAAGSVTHSLPAPGLPGLSTGATVEMDVRGRTTSPVRTISRVLRAGYGAGGTDPTAPLSTPEIAEIQTEADVFADGTVMVTAWIYIWQIAEQYRQRQRIDYHVEIRTAAGVQIAKVTTGPRELTAAQVETNFTLGGATLSIEPTTTVTPAPSYAFDARGIVEVEGELIRYDGSTDGGGGALDLSPLSAGYNGTTAASHSAGTLVVSRAELAVAALGPNQALEARVTAKAPDSGRSSNPSAWVAFTTDVDTTAPGWAAAPITPTVSSGPTKFTVRWAAADQDAEDLAYYEVQASPDNATWTTYRAGSGTTFHLEAEPGQKRYFRVRAVDTSGNASAWSNAASGYTLPVAPAGETLLDEGFESGMTGWTWLDDSNLLTSAAVDSVEALVGSQSLKITNPRSDGVSTFGVSGGSLTAPSITVAAGDVLYVRWLMRRSGGWGHANDVISLELAGLGRYALYEAGSDLAEEDDGEWTLYEGIVEVPYGVSSLVLTLVTSTNGGYSPSQTPKVWVDAVLVRRVGTAAGTGGGVLRTNSSGKAAPAQLQLGSGVTLTGLLEGSKTWDPPSLTNGASTSTTVTVTGAVVGNHVVAVTHSQVDENYDLVGVVTAADTVTVRLTNRSGSTRDVASGTLKALVAKT